nr:MAG TPA: hypothetical protein [Caudoviricetes sp.]
MLHRQRSRRCLSVHNKRVWLWWRNDTDAHEC